MNYRPDDKILCLRFSKFGHCGECFTLWLGENENFDAVKSHIRTLDFAYENTPIQLIHRSRLIADTDTVKSVDITCDEEICVRDGCPVADEALVSELMDILGIDKAHATDAAMRANNNREISASLATQNRGENFVSFLRVARERLLRDPQSAIQVIAQARRQQVHNWAYNFIRMMCLDPERYPWERAQTMSG